MSPIRLIASQLADLEPYRSSPDARRELLDAAALIDRELTELRKRVKVLEQRQYSPPYSYE